ncbi:uncharacterized protein METZ01_LOCUS497425, partial [marine metagenome]
MLLQLCRNDICPAAGEEIMFDIRGVNSSAFKFACETAPAKKEQGH